MSRLLDLRAVAQFMGIPGNLLTAYFCGSFLAGVRLSPKLGIKSMDNPLKVNKTENKPITMKIFSIGRSRFQSYKTP
jgi:hypothetical protein